MEATSMCVYLSVCFMCASACTQVQHVLVLVEMPC